MTKLLTVAMFFACTGWALGQVQEFSSFGPCSSKTPDGVPCADPTWGVVVRFPEPIWTERLPPVPPTGPFAVAAPVEGQPVTLPSARNDYQYWSYQPNGRCDYHDGGNTVHFDAGALQNYASNRAQFQASYQAGQAMGSAIGVLVGAWIAHHRGVVQKRNDIRQQISAYWNATFDLDDEVIRDQDMLAADYALLMTIDPPRRSIYEEGAGYTVEVKALFATARPLGEKLLPEILAATDLKCLRECLQIAEKHYHGAQNTAEQQYVFLRFIGGLAGYFAYQQTARPASAEKPADPQ